MATQEKKIVVQPNGPYLVYGGIPLVRKAQVISEHGEPLTWKKEDEVETKDIYALCRCGLSETKPFCDGAHAKQDFDGQETADTGVTADRQTVFEGHGIVVKRDYSLCMHAGFCGNRFTNIEKMVPETNESQVRAQVMAMVERCPSGSYTYTLEADGTDVEPDYPEVVALTVEGDHSGAIWVTGNVPIQRADGENLETRPRVTLCRCGESKNKPLCDGTHRAVGFQE